MRRSRSSFAEAWKDEFDGMLAGIDWVSMTVPGRARVLKRLKEDAFRATTFRVGRREVPSCRHADIESIERKFKRRAHRLAVTQDDLRQYG